MCHSAGRVRKQLGDVKNWTFVSALKIRAFRASVFQNRKKESYSYQNTLRKRTLTLHIRGAVRQYES
jgi:hypothetical protein